MVAPTNNFGTAQKRNDSATNLLQSAETLCSRLLPFENREIFIFEPSTEDLGTMYALYMRLLGKHHSHLPLAIIKLFTSWYSCSVMVRYV